MPYAAVENKLQQVCTRYTVTNNSPKRVQHLYIDHNAGNSHGGFVITTTDRCIKSVMGFSRYEFQIKPLEEITFDVLEEATYKETVQGSSLTAFMDKRLPKLLQAGTAECSKNTVTVLESVVKKQKKRRILDDVNNRSVTNDQINAWKAAGLIAEHVLAIHEELSVAESSIAQCDADIAVKNEVVKQIYDNQTRLRENIKSMKEVGLSCIARHC